MEKYVPQRVKHWSDNRTKLFSWPKSKVRHSGRHHFTNNYYWIITATQKLTPTIETGDSLQASWAIDASFATHHEIKNHTGGTLS